MVPERMKIKSIPVVEGGFRDHILELQSLPNSHNGHIIISCLQQLDAHMWHFILGVAKPENVVVPEGCHVKWFG